MKTDTPFDFFFQWHLTERCNLKCLHCYQDGRPVKEMTLNEIIGAATALSDTINQWSELYEIPFLPSVNVTGGEPFLRSDLSEILISLYGHGFDLYLLTNGTLIGEREAAMLAGVSVSGIQVSIEGPEEIHDKIRGKGALQAALRGILLLVSQGLRVTLNLTLSTLNVTYIEDMISLANSLGVRRVGFSRLVPSGRGLGLIDRMLEKKALQDTYEKIHSMNIPGIEIVTGDPVYSCMVDQRIPENLDIPFGGCAAGISGLTILPDGTLVPCRRLNIPIGNILEDNVREVWAASPVLEALRRKEEYKGKCGSCNHWAHCRGCRAIAYQHSLSRGRNNLLEEDPQCFITV